MTKSPSEPEGWALIPAPAGLPAVPDMTTAQLVEELARLGNNYRRVSPHLSAVIARAVDGLAAPQPKPGRAVWRARSASDRTDDWPQWYVTDDQPADRNKTHEAAMAAFGVTMPGPPFCSRKTAENIAKAMNARAVE